MRLLLSLASAAAARHEVVKALAVNFSDNKALFALELLIANVPGLLKHLRALSVDSPWRCPSTRTDIALSSGLPTDAPVRLHFHDVYQVRIPVRLPCVRSPDSVGAARRFLLSALFFLL